VIFVDGGWLLGSQKLLKQMKNFLSCRITFSVKLLEKLPKNVGHIVGLGINGAVNICLKLKYSFSLLQY
jgi:hypothetical protein